MNAERNGREQQSNEEASSQAVEVTSFALGQLDARRTREIEMQAGSDAVTKQIIDETQRLAAAIQDSADRGLPAGIEGLEREIERAFDDLAEIAGDDKVVLKPKPNFKGRWRSTFMACTALSVFLIAGFNFLILPTMTGIQTSSREMDKQHANEEKHSDLLTVEAIRRAESRLPRLQDQSPSAGTVFESAGDDNGVKRGFEMQNSGGDNVALKNILPSQKLAIPFSQNDFGSATPQIGGFDFSGERSTRKDTSPAQQSNNTYSITPDPTAKYFNDGSADDVKLGYESRSLPKGADSAGLVANSPPATFGVPVNPAGDASGSMPAIRVNRGGYSQDVRFYGFEGEGQKDISNLALLADGKSLDGYLGQVSQAEEKIRQQIAKLIVERDRLANTYGHAHPTVIASDKRIDEWTRYRAKLSGEQYELPPENSFVPVAGENALSTFSIDVDTASYANVRRFINNRQMPPPAAVRIEELINYFDYDYPQPQGNAPFSVNMEVAACPWNTSHKLLRVGIKGKEIHRDERPASNLVFLLDVSGSMADADKLPLLKRAMLMLVDRLTENDRVSIVTYAGNAGTRLQPTSGDQKRKIRSVIENLSASGSTHGSAGIQMAYDLASQNFISEGVNRVILATDGDLNVGITRDDALVRLIEDKANTGVFLTVLGFGTGNLKDAKLEKLADNGNGSYCYIDSIREAQKVLIEQMSGNLVTIAKDVKIQIEFNPAEIRAYRLIGYENRRLANQDFDNDLVDAGEIGAGHTVTALYELVTTKAPANVDQAIGRTLKYQQAAKEVKDEAGTELTRAAESGELMTLFLRFKDPDAAESEMVEYPIKDSDTPFDEASNDFRFAASVASFGMVLRHSRYAGSSSLDKIELTAATTIGEDPQGHRSEFVDLVRQVASMSGHRR